MLHFWLLLHPVDPEKKPLNIGPYPPKSHLKPLDSTEILGFSGNHGHFIQFQSLLSPAPWLHPGMALLLVPAYDVDASRLVSFFHQNQDLRRNSMNAYLRKSGNLALLKNWTNGTWKMMAFCRIFRWTCLVGNRTLWPKASPACVPGLCRVGLRRTICKPEAPSNRILHKIRLLLGGSFDSRQGSSQWEPSQKRVSTWWLHNFLLMLLTKMELYERSIKTTRFHVNQTPCQNAKITSSAILDLTIIFVKT